MLLSIDFNIIAVKIGFSLLNLFMILDTERFYVYNKKVV